MRIIKLLFLLAVAGLPLSGWSQIVVPIDSLVDVSNVKFYKDSAYRARQKYLLDSASKFSALNIANISKESLLLDSIVNANKNPELTPFNFAQVFAKNASGNLLKQGNYLPKGEIWTIYFIAGFLVLFAALKYSFSRQLQTIVQAFFSNRVLANLNKEDSLFTSWPFLLLFILFGFVIGMFYFLVTQFYQLAGGFKYFLSLSALIVLLYFVKIVLLKAIGFFFDVKKPINEYITILCLSYFNVGLLFLPLVVAFALSPLKFGIYFIVASYVILALTLGLQFIRAGINILSNYRFRKLYLFLYFCALEICPILILIKAIR